ncbi:MULTISPECIES: ATP-binding cassette domain-containing protein [unclassified Bacillus (in: firmicutes)]|uniref:ATP-binding cassette domain-containing protein n=1 Tax=unclassified Bacillus (in: firmicutes) TaxID=185979 RepID=UPI001BE843F4|nr:MULTISPECIES: ATP-binding cassette domain-containing protein [unclassified Bacillus (in: firmicutes)]MBT2637868.1 ATP-binding cassette domain-containing protein [Bacillus sp. ISL-39]MBT2661040.1 ATP-binding cassette domain-containing protein [Bacillus sp. ISL-45]
MKSGGKEQHIHLNNLKKSFDNTVVLDGISLKVNHGEFIAIVGKSGCGKSTLLRLIAGLEKYDEGAIYIKDKKLDGLNAHARIMFQDGRLLPWKKVLENVGIGLKGKWEHDAMEALKDVGLEGRMKDWPSKLSGGQKQRVALARGLVHKPEILLLDEPLGALDALTRLEMQELIESIWEKEKITSILVTHDVEEAVALADRVILIEDGKIVLSKTINLPRPRQRTQQVFTNYVDEILSRIIDPNEKNLRLIIK